jgi:quinol-cytochrome oxidoreductase complex cytochrome b subunit
MEIIKAIGDNIVLVSAIIFVLLLVLYGLFYKKGSGAVPSKKSDQKEDPSKKNKEKFISYLFGSLAIYALYLIYIKYVTRNLIESTMPQGAPPRMGMSGGAYPVELVAKGASRTTAENAQKLANALGSYSVKMTGDDIDVGFLE